MRSSSKELLKTNDLARCLRRHRIHSGKTRTEIAKTVGATSSKRISHIERGLALPDPQLLKILIEIYKMNEPLVLQIFQKECSVKWNFTTEILKSYFNPSTNEVKSSATSCKKS